MNGDPVNKEGVVLDTDGNPIEVESDEKVHEFAGFGPKTAAALEGMGLPPESIPRYKPPTPEQQAQAKALNEYFQQCAKVRERNSMLDGIATSILISLSAADIRNDEPTPPSELAKRAYKIATAMLAERQNHLLHEPEPPPGYDPSSPYGGIVAAPIPLARSRE